MQNGYIESFNGRLRDECLNASWFVNLADAMGEDLKAGGKQGAIPTGRTAAWITEPHKSSRKFTQSSPQQDGRHPTRTARRSPRIARRCSRRQGSARAAS